ncbi:MAG: hypothetical protein R3B09_00880 [Nannocystaceae bacterium]
MRRLAPLLLTWTVIVACSGDDGSTSDTTVTATAGTSTGTTAMSTSTDATTTTGVETTEGTATTTTTTDATTDMTTSTTDESTSSSTTGPVCDPPVVGQYNDCTDEMGKVDNKLCKYIGTGQSVGFLSCLNSAGVMGASTCTIIQCVDDCDCFNVPPTGTATSVCKPMATDKGDAACLLDCSDGATCPDGMVCDNDTCFWPP